jgi:predicted nucleic acid-binding protein
MNLVVDASIALKWFVSEADSAAATSIRLEHDLAAPDLILIECRNALLNKVRRGEIDAAQAMAAEAEISAIQMAIVPSAAHLSSAFALALELKEPIYDCLYLAMAIATGWTLVTADRSFVTATRNSRIKSVGVKLLSEL